MKNQVRVLQVLIGGNTFTGVSSYLYQYYKFIDRNVVQKTLPFIYLMQRKTTPTIIRKYIKNYRKYSKKTGTILL